MGKQAKKISFWRRLRPVLVASLAVCACHAPGGGWSVAQSAAPWETLPVRLATTEGYAVTLYADGWSLVTERARLALESGEQVVRFAPVAAQVESRGAYLQLAGTVSERRFRYDLQSREQLMQRYHGQRVAIVTATESIPATLLMTETGPVYRIGDRLTTEPGGRVVLPPMAGLATEPALEWIVSRTGPWSGTATASMIVNRLGWQNEYTLRTDADQTRGEWVQWAAIQNHSGGRYADARVTLVAGDVRRDSRPPMPLAFGGARAYAMEDVSAEGYAARYQYVLSAPLTLEREVESRHRLAGAEGVPISRSFRFASSVNLYRAMDPELPRKAQIRLTIPNTESAKLGKPLPRGKVTVYTPNPQGVQQVAGEPAIPDTPQGQPLLLELGEAFDVTMERRQIAHEVTAEGTRIGYQLVLRNRMDKPASVVISELIPHDWTVVAHSHPYERASAAELRFSPQVAAKGEVTLSYTVRIQTETLPRGAAPTSPNPSPELR